MTQRTTRARVQSLCGTARRLKKKKVAIARVNAARRPCRFAALWACQGSGERSRRMAEATR
jgi:hypothetical protein